MQVRGSNIVITGANRGIGLAVAERFAQDRAHLYLVNRSLDEKLAERLLALGAASVQVYQADLSDAGQVGSLLEKLQQQEVDILFNNSGQLVGGPLDLQDARAIENMFQVNVMALVQLTRGVLPQMLKRKRGKIINNASVAAYMHFPGSSTYSATKAAVVAFTRCLQAELAGSPVSALLLVTPGIETRMWGEIEEKFKQSLDVKLVQAIPAQRFADMVHEAVIQDLEVLEPGGAKGLGLFVAKHAPKLFDRVVARYRVDRF